MTNFRKIAAFSALTLALVVGSSAAFARGKGDHEKLAFPVAGATFKQHVEARIEKKRAKLESRIADKKIPADKAAEMRARFNDGATKIKAEADKAAADGTVTKEEAKEVRKIAKEMRGKHGKKHGKRGDKGTPA